MKTFIAVPCMDEVSARFAQCLCTLTKVGDCSVSFQMGSLIYESRNKLASRALQDEADYVMWFDSDMVFSQDVMMRMLEHMKVGKDMVTGVYYRRVKPYTPVLFKSLEIEDGVPHWEGYDDYPEDEPFKLDGAGFGCVMVKASVLLDMIAQEGNWFEPMYGFGEDLSFFMRAKKCGYQLWCDPAIQCGHVGKMIVAKDFYDTYSKGKPAE